MKNKNQFIPSVNFHLWEPCNMKCRFCFATFQDVKQSILPTGHLPKEQAVRIVLELARAGFQKITFAGGEPTLCPWLPELIKTAKQAGLTTMIVTNGSKLDDAFLEQNKDYLDWIAISIDSANPRTNLQMGRAIAGKKPLTLDYYKTVIVKIMQFGYGLKINTVVNSKNFMEDMTGLIRFAEPKRWKILQALPIIGQNDSGKDEMFISGSDFNLFVERHKSLADITRLVPESSEQIRGSYAMVDPAGRFFDNASGYHNYSSPILEVGISDAMKQVNYDFQKFTSRGGIYDWIIEKPAIPLRITISGEVASGKSTIGRLLAEKLNYDFVSIGNKTRKLAAKRGMEIVEFQKECLLNPSIDLQIDREFSDECNSCQHIVVDYRLGYKFIRNAYHVFLKIPYELAIERLKIANRHKETYHSLHERNAAFKTQFKNAYNVDYTDESNYDLVINIDKDTSSESIAKFIIQKLNPDQQRC